MRARRMRIATTLACTALLLAAASLAGCGFKPMYASSDESDSAAAGQPQNVKQALAAVAIGTIPDHDGVKLRQILRERMQPSGATDPPLYTLDVQIRVANQQLGIQKNAVSTRANMTFTANFFLLQKGEHVYGAQSQSIVSYDILNDQYATVASQGEADDRALKQLGDDIVARLSVYLGQHLPTAAVH